MKEITDINEVHNILLDIGNEFHRICVENNIPYYMIGGTMLGAIRHKGFIPWDDDMDFGVPREYFEKLKDVLKNKLPHYYQVHTLDNSDVLILDMIKIVDNRTRIIEIFKENIESNGINIDIFPLDIVATQKANYKIIDIIIRLQEKRFLSIAPLKTSKRIIGYIIKVLFFWLHKNTLTSFINNYLIDNEGDYVTNIYGAWRGKETFPKEIIGQPILYNFEDTNFFGVSNFDYYLKQLYGNYMQLPPEDKRHIHLSGAYWK